MRFLGFRKNGVRRRKSWGRRLQWLTDRWSLLSRVKQLRKECDNWRQEYLRVSERCGQERRGRITAEVAVQRLREQLATERTETKLEQMRVPHERLANGGSCG